MFEENKKLAYELKDKWKRIWLIRMIISKKLAPPDDQLQEPVCQDEHLHVACPSG